jgi:hypothetical protein
MSNACVADSRAGERGAFPDAVYDVTLLFSSTVVLTRASPGQSIDFRASVSQTPVLHWGPLQNRLIGVMRSLDLHLTSEDLPA